MANQISPSTIKKIVHMEGRQFGGYLTPSEIIAISKIGARSDGGSTFNSLDYAKQRVKQGNSRPYWFYFNVTDKSELRKKIDDCH